VKIEYKKFKSKRNFGVELEISNTVTYTQIEDYLLQFEQKTKKINVIGHPCWEQTIGNYSSGWHIKTDSTCGIQGKGKDKGLEVASYVASGIKDILHIANAAEYLKSKGAEVNPNCGLHVHVSAKDFNGDQIGVLTAYWLKIEKVLVNSVPSSRKNNKYCRLLRNKRRLDLNKAYTATEVFYAYRPTELYIHENNDKLVSFNTIPWHAANCKYYSNATLKPTVELRLPAGTLEKRNVLNWVRLFVRFVDLCKDYKMPDLSSATVEETLNILGLQGDEEFYLLSPGLYDLKTWLLENVIQFGHHKIIKKEAQKIFDFVSENHK